MSPDPNMHERPSASPRASRLQLRLPLLSSPCGPNVWSGRALQENFVELAVSGLASMYPAFGWSVASWPSWISARVRSHYGTGPNQARWATSVRTRREDRTSISSHPLAEAGAMAGVASNVRPRAKTLQAIRASLLASAIARSTRCSRFLAASIQALSP
jgi:hypothetical protein